MRTILAILLVAFSGVAMAGDISPLKASETGRYDEIARRPNPENYVILFIPALIAILLSVERKNGGPLNQAQVEAVRDTASVVVSPLHAAQAVEDKRGYRDLDPREVWKEWQVARKELQE
jgi:hypothetical protein